MDQTVLARIRREKEDFLTKNVQLAPGYAFNQYDTIQRIEDYFHSRFQSGPTDPDGWVKPFYNITRKPCAVAAKEIDLDTKDIIIRAENGDYVTAEIMAADFKQWMKDEGFAADLNEYADLCPEYGSIVVKKVGDRLATVNLKTLILSNVQAKTLKHTNSIEVHPYSRDEFVTEAGKKKWDKAKVKEILKIYDEQNKTDIVVDERYGWVKESELKSGGSDTTMVFSMFLAAGTDLVQQQQSADGKQQLLKELGVVLEHIAVTEAPYREWHWSRMPYRWLGVGFVEMLFDAQVRMNENEYYKAKALAWLATHGYVTDDETVTRNLMNDMKNGDVLRVQRGAMFQEIQMGERNLSYYASVENRWDKNIADVTFTPEIITGEGLPSGTAARTAIISDQNVKKYFDRKREDFGIFIKALIVDDILPLFEKQSSNAHTFSFGGSGADREALEKRILNTRMVAMFQNYGHGKKRLPSLTEWQSALLTERQRIAASPTLDIDVPKDAYKGLKYRLDVVITKENEDTDSKLSGRQVVLKLLAENPSIATNPVTRPVFLELAEFLGVKNLNLPTEAEVQSMQPAPAAAGPGPGGVPPSGQPAPTQGDPLAMVPLS